jgi:serine/threonine-protein kinase HipA
MIKRARVLYDGVLAGWISETDEGYEFQYEATYLLMAHPKVVSLTLPLTTEVYKSKVLFPFFDGIIPEGWLLDIATTHWKLRPNDRFELLLATCRDTIGAVTILPDE